MMNKRFLALLLSGVTAASMLAGCGSSSAAADTETEETAAAETTEAVETTSAASDSTNIKFVDGYYATDANGHDFMIVFYENAPGDVAYVNDGTNEVCAEYKVENAKTDDGQDYLLITVGQTQLGYIADGTDGGAYIVDTDGNIYGAQAVTEEEADAIYQALQEAGNASVDSSAADASDVSYVDGYYANDGNGNDFIIAFYTTTAGDLAYVSDGTNEAVAPYTVSDAETDDGTAYTLVTVGETVLGYYVADDGEIYIVDEDGTPYVGGQLSEEEAEQLYSIVTAQ